MILSINFQRFFFIVDRSLNLYNHCFWYSFGNYHSIRYYSFCPVGANLFPQILVFPIFFNSFLFVLYCCFPEKAQNSWLCDLVVFVVWGCRIVWCTLTSWYLVSLLPVSIIHVSDIFLVGFWSWEINFIMWGCRGWGWQGAGTWVSVSPWNGGIPRPHRVTWSRPINMHQ